MIPEKEKEILKGLAVLVVVVAVALLFIRLFGEKTPALPVDEVNITEESPEKTLLSFPEGFPIEEEVSFNESFRYIPVGSNDEQSTVTYFSDLNLDENAEIFENFFSENGFEIVNQVKEEGMYFYYARGSGNDLSILLEDKTGRVSVTASYLASQ